MDYNGASFRDCRVELTGNAYRNCTFENVTLYYEGGVVVLDNCDVDGARIELGGPAADGLEFIRRTAHAQGPKAVKEAVAFVSNVLRKPLPTSTYIIG